MKLSPKFNDAIKKLNTRNTIIIVASVVTFLFLAMVFLHHETKKETVLPHQEKSTKFVPFSNVGDFTDTATNQAISDLDKAQQDESTASEKASKQLQSQIKALQQEVKSLKEAKKPPVSAPTPAASLARNAPTPMPMGQVAPHPVNARALANTSAMAGGEGVSPIVSQSAFQGVSTFTFSKPQTAKTAEDDEQGCTLGHCILPGTFAKAVMIGGADANASVNGQSNTTPVIFRVLKKGTMPNNRHVDIRGCFVIGTVYGDISSERGEVKLTTISCVLHGKVINKSISLGTAYDDSGKEGIRGLPVLRNGKILWNATLSGMASGIGSAIGQASTTTSVSPLGSTTTLNSDQILQAGAGQGAQTALGRLADYYIKRADQYHPIIQLNPGTKVDLVFLSPVTLRPSDSDNPTAATSSASDASEASSSTSLNNIKFGSNISPELANKIKAQLSQHVGAQ